MSEAEMAGRTATPPGTIKSRLNAARKSLKNLLSPQFYAAGSSTSQEPPVTVGALSADSAGRRNGHE